MANTLSVTGKTCHHGANALTTALQAVVRGKKVSVSLDSALTRGERKAKADALIRGADQEGHMAQVVSLK